MPWMNGFVGLDNYVHMLGDGRFWDALRLTAIYTGYDRRAAARDRPRARAAGPADSARSGLFRVVAILPIVLAPVVVGLFWRTLMLSPSFGLVDVFTTQVFGKSTTGSAIRHLR